MGPSLLDSGIITEVFRARNHVVGRKASAYMVLYGRFTFSIIGRYEVLRGLKAANASRSLLLFDDFCRQNEVLELSDSIVVRASDIYADLKRQGQLIGDADILIAATALEHRKNVVTTNVGHFQRVTGLTVEDWTKP